MITKNATLYLYVETPLHAGTGSGLSSIDLPIQRERTTQYPMIQGSSIKGKLRATAQNAVDEKAIDEKKFSQNDVDALFGPSPDKTAPNATNNAVNTDISTDYAGALIAGDARILLFPVRSLNGVFAYTTSYDILSRFKRDIERGQNEQVIPWNVPKVVKNEDGSINALVTTQSEIQSNNSLVLEEFSFVAQESSEVDKIADWIAENALPNLGTGDYWSNKIKRSLVILPNDDFRDFALYATEVITRIRINRHSKTVENGMLWTEEHLPTDTLLYVPMYATSTRKKGTTLKAEQVLEKVDSLNINYIQLGGDETVGRGLVRARWSK